MTKMDHEEATVRAFVKNQKRERYLMLLKSERRRDTVLDQLNHWRDYDPRYATPLALTADVLQLLTEKGSPDTCHVISDNSAIDGKYMSLQKAISAAETGMSGTIISCLPGRLAYYYGEAGEQRLLLERDTA